MYSIYLLPFFSEMHYLLVSGNCSFIDRHLEIFYAGVHPSFVMTDNLKA